MSFPFLIHNKKDKRMKNKFTKNLQSKLKIPMLESIITLEDVYSHKLLKSILDGSIQPLVNDSTSMEMIAHAATFSLFYSSALPDFNKELFTVEKVKTVELLLYTMLDKGKPFDRSMTNDELIVNAFNLFLCDKKSPKRLDFYKKSCFSN